MKIHSRVLDLTCTAGFSWTGSVLKLGFQIHIRKQKKWKSTPECSISLVQLVFLRLALTRSVSAHQILTEHLVISSWAIAEQRKWKSIGIGDSWFLSDWICWIKAGKITNTENNPNTYTTTKTHIAYYCTSYNPLSHDKTPPQQSYMFFIHFFAVLLSNSLCLVSNILIQRLCLRSAHKQRHLALSHLFTE